MAAFLVSGVPEVIDTTTLKIGDEVVHLYGVEWARGGNADQLRSYLGDELLPSCFGNRQPIAARWTGETCQLSFSLTGARGQRRKLQPSFGRPNNMRDWKKRRLEALIRELSPRNDTHGA